VARTLKTRHGHEVAVLGAARADASTGCFLTEFEDIEKFKKSSLVLEVHKLGQTPDFEHLVSLTLGHEDVSALRDCRAGNCGMKLPASAMDSIRRAESSNTAFQQWLLNYLEAYVLSGNAALTEYDDRGKQVRLADEFSALLDAKPSLMELAPEFYTYLAQYPAASLPGVSGFLYWSQENFGLKPVISVTHANIYRQPGQAIIASKQIYANHYFEGSLGLTFLLDGTNGSANSMYIVYLNRSRIDLLGGWLGGLRRYVLRGRLLDGVRGNLRDVVKRLDASCRPPSPW
jgi:hypothetical protein